jgi:hypothetical protein
MTTAATNTAAATAAIKEKISEFEHERVELQRSVQRLAEVSENLTALRKSLDVLNGNHHQAVTISDPPGTRPIVAGTVGWAVMEVLQETNRPMHVKDLLPEVRTKGKAHLKMGTLVSQLCDYVKNGRLKRTAPNTYALP